MHRIEINDVLDLHTFAPQDVEAIVEEYLYQCVQKGIRVARIIHGKGIGVQRQMVRSIVSRSQYIDSYQDGPDWGSTVVYFKM